MSADVGPRATGDAVRAAASAALDDVNSLGLEGEDRRIVLESVLRARLGGFAATAKLPADGSVDGEFPQVGKESGVIGKLSSALKLDQNLLELVYDVQDGEPHIVVAAKKIASNKSEGARQLAQLICAARQIAGIEEWTSVSVVRPVAQAYGRLDTSNFASSLQALDDVAVIRGKGQQREFKITKPGLERTASLITSLVGADS